MTKLFVKKPFLTLVTIVVVITIGIVSLTKMQTNLMPDMELPYMIVIVTDPGASPEEVEEEVIKPSESALGTISGVENLRSTASNNYGYIMLEFAEDTDMNSALVRVSQAVNTISYPEGCGTPNIMEIGVDMMATMYANVNYEGKDIKDLTKFSEKIVQPYLERQDGVASVSATGGIVNTVEIRLNQEKVDKINKKLSDYVENKLDDAQSEIDEGLDKIESGESTLKSQQKKLEKTQKTTNEKLGNANTQLNKAQSTKAAYEANLNSLKTSEAALNAEKKAYEDAKIEENYNQLDSAFAGFQAGLGEMAAAAGIEIPSSVKDCISHPDKLNKFKEWMTSMGMGEQVAPFTVETMKQLSDAKDRLPQIDTELSNLKTEIMAAQTMVDQINKQLKDLDKQQAAAIAGGYAAASAFGAGQAQMSAAQSQLESAKTQLESAQDQLDDSIETALKNANIDKLISLDTLSSLIYAQNFAMPAGYVDDKNDNQWLVEVGDKYEDVDTLKKMVLAKIDGVGTIRVSDVADVVVIDNADESFSKVNGEDALMLAIFKSSTASTGEVSKNIQEAFTELEDKYEGLSFTIMMNQGDYIDRIIDSVLSSILLGAALAVLVLALFLRDVRPTIVVAFSIPFSVLFAIILMYFTGITINVMSLGGLCLGIGMLVDNSIVVMENVYRLRNRGYSAPMAAVYGAKQVAGPIIASTITTVCVFLPMVYTSGIVSQLMIPFAFTISFALAASLLVALTVVPSLGFVMLRKTKNKKSKIYEKIQDLYGNVLAFCLRFKIVPLLISIVLLAFCTMRLSTTGLALLDDMESNQITGSLTMDDECDKETAYATATEAMERIQKVDGVSRVSMMDGSAGLVSSMTGSTSANGFKQFSIYVITEEGIKSTQEFHRIIKDVEKSVDGLEYEDFSVSSSAMGGMGGMMSQGMEVTVSGTDQDKLISISEDVMDMLEETDGFEDVSNGITEQNRQIHITLKKNELAKHSLTVAQVYQQIAGKITSDKTAISLSYENADMDVDIIKDKSELLTYENLMDMKIKATETDSDGKSEEKEYKLSKFAESESGYTMDNITRRNQNRYLSVTASTKEGANTTLLSREVQKKLDKYQVPEGYNVEINGETEQVMDMMKQMLLAIALGLLLIYLVMVAQFQSLLSPFIILFTIPLAFTGGMIGLMIFGKTISAISMMGFMILMGTVVNNGIVFVDYANQLRIKGVEKRIALILTGKTRMRPIIMTALTTILSMSVMVFSNDAGNAMQKGMAIVVSFGLIYSTFMTLFIVPVLYDIFYRRKPMVIDVDDEVENIPDETEDLLEEYGYSLELED
ncbi:MAG: efflux RND transporter permease subunit [Eubacteriales bacterium]|nr:efflux RND transporter permease subunit [Eubacteriales bacterium]